MIRQADKWRLGEGGEIYSRGVHHLYFQMKEEAKKGRGERDKRPRSRGAQGDRLVSLGADG